MSPGSFDKTRDPVTVDPFEADRTGADDVIDEGTSSPSLDPDGLVFFEPWNRGRANEGVVDVNGMNV